MDLPKISIITPSFNQGQFIEETILSVINQDYENLEYIIIDGGSTDKTLDIIKDYEDFITFWKSEPDEGQTHAINKGFKMATGELVAWMNSDDIYINGVFKRVAELYINMPTVDVFYADKMHIDENGNELFIQRYVPYRIDTFANDKMVICNQACFWKRKLFDRIGYLDESIDFAMDYEFFIRMGTYNLNFEHFPEIWGKQRYHGGTKSADKSWLKILKSNREEINQKYGLKKNLLKKIISKILRAMYYIRTGNFKYLFTSKDDGI